MSLLRQLSPFPVRRGDLCRCARNPSLTPFNAEHDCTVHPSPPLPIRLVIIDLLLLLFFSLVARPFFVLYNGHSVIVRTVASLSQKALRSSLACALPDFLIGSMDLFKFIVNRWHERAVVPQNYAFLLERGSNGCKSTARTKHFKFYHVGVYTRNLPWGKLHCEM